MADISGLLILPSTISHVKEVAKIMRRDDAEEVMASGGYTPEEALRTAFFSSDFCSTGWLHDKFAAMFGIVSTHGVHVGWLLTTDYVEDYPRLFYRSCKEVLKDLLEYYPSLVNMIDDRHKRALIWAKHLGFEIGPAIPFGVKRMLFHRVEIRRTQCASLSLSPSPQA